GARRRYRRAQPRVAGPVNLPGTLGLPLRGPRHALEPGDREGELRVIRLDSGESIGVVAVEPAGETLHIHSVCIDEGKRGWGGGSESVQLLVEAAAGRFGRATAVAPVDEGLPVYFWVRMGFSPRFGVGPGGGLLFERDLP